MKGAVLLLALALALAGCGSHKPNKVKVPTWIPCGVPVEFTKDDGHVEVWTFPCWPEKNEPKCVKGCPA